MINQRGITIVDGLMGVLILSIVSVGTATLINNSMRNSKAVESIQNATETAGELKEHMWKGSICTGNLKGQPVAIGTEINLVKLRAYDAGLNDLGADLIAAGVGNSARSAVVLEHIGIVPVTQVSADTYLATVNVNFENRFDAAGAQAFRRSFPISIRVNTATNEISSCGAVGVDSATPQSVCMASGGDFNPETGSCTRQACNRGTGGNIAARCAVGAVGSGQVDCNTDIPGYPGKDNCDWFVDAGAHVHDMCGDTNDPIQKALRRYGPTGQLIESAPPPYIVETKNINGGKATCTFATDLGVDAQKWTCGVWCWRRE